MMKACGIDFGTSNSSIGILDATGPRLLPVQRGETSVPTAIFFSFDDNTTAFGLEALDRYFVREPGRYIRAIKSVLGTRTFEETTQVKGKRYTFGEIIASFLRFLRAAARDGHDDMPGRVVLGRPAFFVDDDPVADAAAESQLAAAARQAGFAEVAFQFEPIAAALDYEQSVNGEEIALVADIGGGTSDFSIVRVSPGRKAATDRRGDILGCTGIHIGGTDFDRLLALSNVMPWLGLRSALKQKPLEAPSWYFHDLATWHRINFLYDPKIIGEIRTVLRDSAEPRKIERLLNVLDARKGHTLLAKVEAAKTELSRTDAADLDLRADAVDVTLQISRAALESAIDDSLQRLKSRLQDVLRLAGLTAADVSTIFLTGGSTRMPSVKQAIAQCLPEARLVTGDAFGSVATGLALDAARRFR